MLYDKISIENVDKSLIVLKPIQLDILKSKEGYSACWNEANIYGCVYNNLDLAIKDIKKLISTYFKIFEDFDDKKLGIEMLRQKKIYQNYLKRK